MPHLRLAASVALLALLPACAERAEAPAPDGDASPITAPTVATTAATAAPTARLPLVPARFHGVWDTAEGSCEPATDMRIEIAERGITFYESHGAVTAITLESPDRMTAELAMKGEGESWTTTRTFMLSEDGAMLTPSGGGDTGPPQPLKRCV